MKNFIIFCCLLTSSIAMAQDLNIDFDRLFAGENPNQEDRYVVCQLRNSTRDRLMDIENRSGQRLPHKRLVLDLYDSEREVEGKSFLIGHGYGYFSVLKHNIVTACDECMAREEVQNRLQNVNRECLVNELGSERRLQRAIQVCQRQRERGVPERRMARVCTTKLYPALQSCNDQARSTINEEFEYYQVSVWGRYIGRRQSRLVPKGSSINIVFEPRNGTDRYSLRCEFTADL